MLRSVIAYVAATVVFLGVDFLWLTRMGPAFYRPRLGGLLLENANFVVAGGFYLAYGIAIVVLAVLPAAGNFWVAIGMGAVLGAAAYGTYDMTNLATIRDWSVAVTMVDIAWGTFLTALGAAAGTLAYRLAS